MQRYSFRPKHRLLEKSDFSRVFDKVDHRVGKGPILVLARKNDLGHPRLGLIVRKKFLKRAVDRNLLKRVSRENFRLKQYELENLDIIVMNRSGCDQQSRKMLHKLVQRAFDGLPNQNT